jgi:hypothetical protein
MVRERELRLCTGTRLLARDRTAARRRRSAAAQRRWQLVGTCSNVSVSYHLRRRHAEYYFAYGNPNALVTAPQAILKVILYFGADKGT